MPDTTQQEKLHRYAATYADLGYSVIPIYGDQDPSRSKQAALPWREFQRRRATQSQIDRWFLQEQHAGLAIVTGAISNLVILDFDDAEQFALFKRRFPQLTQTYTVTSAGRQMPHLYFRIPIGTIIPTQHGDGVDLLGEGSYAVAAPTQFNDKAYEVTNGKFPVMLTSGQIDRILQFVRSTRNNTGQPALDVFIPQISAMPQGASPTAKTVAMPLPQWNEQDAVAAYLQRCRQGGRNDALFRTAIDLRDQGWNRNRVVNALAVVHMNQAPPPGHPAETPQQRLREARATIDSAFSRPPRPQRERLKTDSTTPAIPNMLREYFLQRNEAAVVRVLEGLLHAGVLAGARLKEREFCEKLEKTVGRYSIRKALNARLDDGSPIFEESEDGANPSPAPPSPADAATADAGGSNNSCELSRVPSPNKKRRGRPATYYRVPSIARLCEHLGIANTYGDPLTNQDIASPAHYRRSLERGLFKRRPGQYTNAWLAERLGVSRRTVQRYHRDEQIRSRAAFQRVYVTWETLGRVPEDNDIDGMFLETEYGKRYPAKRALAAKLLSKKEKILLCRQEGSFYWHIDNPLDVYQLEMNALADLENAEMERLHAKRGSSVDDLKQREFKPFSPDLASDALVTPPANRQRDFFQIIERDVTKPDTVPMGTIPEASSGFRSPNDPPYVAPAFRDMAEIDENGNYIPPKWQPERKADASKRTEKKTKRPISDAEREQKRQKRRKRKKYAQPLYDDVGEAVAQQLQRTVDQIAERIGNPTAKLSRNTARALTDEYGVRAVRNLCAVLRQREDIENPAGFAVAWLRSEQVAKRQRLERFGQIEIKG